MNDAYAINQKCMCLWESMTLKLSAQHCKLPGSIHCNGAHRSDRFLSPSPQLLGRF